MNDPRRVQMPWYKWRWRLTLWPPLVFFAWLAGMSMVDFKSSPLLSLLFGGVFLAFALLFARQMWRERYPLHSEMRR